VHIFLEKKQRKNNNNKIMRHILDSISDDQKIFDTRELKRRRGRKRQKIISLQIRFNNKKKRSK
jgi:hypothetical protein